MYIINIRHGWLTKKVARCLGDSLGQATTEIAVMGTIMLVIFSVLLRYGQMFNAQQEAQMYTFRKSVELANKRYAGGKFGGVTLVAMKDYQPVDLFSSEPQPTYASGSSSIVLDEAQYLYERDNPVPRADSAVTYYQIGNDMIKKNELVEVPEMYVKRKIDKSKAPRTSLDTTVDVLSWIVDPFGFQKEDKEYNAYESVPFWDQNQTTRGEYNSEEQRIAYYSGGVKSDYSEDSSKDVNTITTYEAEPVNKIRASDELIMTVYSVPPSMVVEQNQTVEKERSYSAW